MLEARLRVSNTLGLHARAAAQLVRLSNRYRSDITIVRLDTDLKANAKSILSVLNLAAAVGVDLEIAADGEDEAEAIKAITDLFTSNFGEE